MSRHTTPLLLIVLVSSLNLFTGCKEKAPATETSTTVDKPAVDEGVRAIDEAFYIVSERCTLSSNNHIETCEGEVRTPLEKAITTHGYDVLPVLATALSDTNTNRRRLAAYVLKRHVPTMLDKRMEAGETPSKERAKELIAAHAKAPLVDLVPRDTISPIVAVGTAAGADEEVIEMIQRFDPSRRKANLWVRAEGITALMRYSRLEHFEVVRAELDSPHIELQRAALDAALAMEQWTQEEAKTLCPLAADLMRARRDDLEARPAQMLLRCPDRPRWRGVLLDEAATRVEDKSFDDPFAKTVRDACPQSRDRSEAMDTICERAQDLFMTILREEGHSVGASKQAISSLGRIPPTPEVEELLKGIAAGEDETLARRAEVALDRLDLRRRIIENAEKSSDEDLSPRTREGDGDGVSPSPSPSQE